MSRSTPSARKESSQSDRTRAASSLRTRRDLILCVTGLLPCSGVPRLCRQNSSLLHGVESRICFTQQTLNRVTGLRIDGNADADGKLGSRAFVGNAVADTACHTFGGFGVCFRQDKSKLVPAEARRRIDVPATEGQNIGNAAEGLASDHVSVVVVDVLQTVQVE